MKKQLRTFLVYLPWVYLACYAVNALYFNKVQVAVDLNLAQIPEIMATPEVVKARISSPEIKSMTAQRLSQAGIVQESLFDSFFERPLVPTQFDLQGSQLRLSLVMASDQNAKTAIGIQAAVLEQDLLKQVGRVRQRSTNELQTGLDRVNQELLLAKSELKELSSKVSFSQKQKQILEYQNLAKTLGPKHPKMEALLLEINSQRKASERLNAKSILALELNEIEASEVVQSQIEVIKTNILKLKSDRLELESKISNVSAPLITKTQPFEVPLNFYDSTWFASIYQAIFFGLVWTGLLALINWRRPTLSTVSIFNDQTGLPQDRVIAFPQLKPKRSSMIGRYLPHLKSKPALIPNSRHPIVSVTQNMLTVIDPEQRDRQTEDQQSLEGMAAELMIKAKYRKHKFFLFSAAAAGAGSTTVVANLAVAFSNLSEKVLVIDANFHNSSISDFFGINGGAIGLAELVLSGQSANHFIQASNFSDLDVLPLGCDKSSASKLIGTAVFAKLIKSLSKTYNFILIDGGSILDSAQATLLADQLGAVYLVVNAETTPKDLTKKALARLEKIKVKIDGVILNQAKA